MKTLKTGTWTAGGHNSWWYETVDEGAMELCMVREGCSVQWTLQYSMSFECLLRGTQYDMRQEVDRDITE